MNRISTTSATGRIRRGENGHDYTRMASPSLRCEIVKSDWRSQTDFDLDKPETLSQPRAMMKTIPSIISTLSLFCLTLPANVQAVVPPPDGGYPNFTTAEGSNALNFLTTGAGNTGVGWRSLFLDSTGSFNTGLGAGALVLNNGDSNTAAGAAALLLNTSGTKNTAVGTDAMVYNDTGTDNTAVGAFVLFSNTEGEANTANGVDALFSNTTGSANTANGFQALYSNTTGLLNIASGYQALYNNTSGSGNVAIGIAALFENQGDFNTAVGGNALLHNTTGIQNTAIGAFALQSNTTGGSNTATGLDALQGNIGGFDNTAYGFNALENNTIGDFNTATGSGALLSNTTGTINTAMGINALRNNTTGGNNTAVGAGAGFSLTTGFNNIDIGNPGNPGESDTIRIGDANQTRTFISGIRDVTTATPAIPVLVSTTGQLGTMSSSRRFKNEIKPMNQTSEAIHALKPVTFHYKSDNTGTPQFGLIAEDVAQVNPDLVVRDGKGEIYTVRYEAVNAMLLNEFLKEHRKVQELERQQKTFESKFAEQAKQIEALTSGLQKVSAQFEVRTATPQIAAENP
jgi:trimeric autotransporter adhesin